LPTTLDPHHHNESVGWSLLCNFYDALVRLTPEMRIEPSLAESWTVLDANHVRFALRRGVRFSNGEPFGSADVVASFERALRDPRSKIRHYLVGIRKVVADGNAAVVIETASPSPTLLNRLAFLFIVPHTQASVVEITQPIGTGPYRFVERRSDGSIVAEAWPGWRGTADVRRVVFSFVEDEDTRSDRFVSGSVDVSVRLVDAVLGEIERHQGLRVKQQASLGVQILVVAPRAATGEARRAFGDPRVRRAMLMAIDREGLVGKIFRGNGAVASQYVQPVVFGYDPGLSPVPFDLPHARRLLSEAGFPDGFSVELAHGSIPKAYVAALVEDLGRLGVKVTAKELTLAELLRRARAGELPLLTYGRACTTADASEFLDSSVHTRDALRGLGLENYSGESSFQTDALLEAANTEMDPVQRLALLQRAQRQVLAELPILPLTIRPEFVGLSERIDIPIRYDAWMWVAGFRWER
jgi:peptide/nickel transport system substrate-binding protein